MIHKIRLFVSLIIMVPLLGVVSAQTYNVPSSGTQTISICSGTIYDPGGTGSYSNNCSGTLIVQSSSPNCRVHIEGSYDTENSYDKLYVYEGVGTTGTLYGTYTGQGSINITSASGALTLRFTSDVSVTKPGFELQVTCAGGCDCGGAPTNLVLQNNTNSLHVSWNASDPTVNNYYLEYGIPGFTPGTGTGVWVTGTSYDIPNPVAGQEYEVHVYFDCGNDLVITTESYSTVFLRYEYNVPSSGTQTISICSGTIYDPGGTNDYSNNCTGILVLQPATPGCVARVFGNFNTESNYDKLYIYDGVGTTGTLYGPYEGTGSLNVISNTGPLTLKFTSDGSVVRPGFELHVECTGSCTCGGGPVNLNMQAISDFIRVSWNACLDPTVSTYYLEYGPSGFTPGTGTGVWVTGTSYDITGLMIGQEYDAHVYFDCGNDHLITNEPFSSSMICVPDTVSCIDLTSLNSPNILCQYGSFSNPYQYTGVVDDGWQAQTSRHTVNLQQATDPRTGGLLNILPPCEKYSVRLGNWASSSKAESITYTFHVDTADAAILLLKYAAVLQDPNHTQSEQPRFKFELLDQNNNLVDPVCGAADYIANAALDWNTASSDVLWKDWTTVGTDLSAYHGQNIRVRLTTYDCDQGAHYGYAYFHLNCHKKNITVESCGETIYNTYSAPAGFNYNWYYQSSPNTIISTAQSVTVPSGNDRLCCKVISLNNPSCFFTLWTTLTSRYPMAEFSATNRPCSYQYDFSNQSFVSSDELVAIPTGESCQSATWIFGDGTTSDDLEPTHQFPGPGTYPVTLVAKINHGLCTDTLTSYITVVEYHLDTTIVDTTVCGEYVWGDTTYTHSGIYMRRYQAASGCDSIVTLRLTALPPVTSSFTASSCNNYTWNGQTYTQSGDYVQHFQTSHGCDSAVTLHLTIWQPVATSFTASNCNSYAWNGQTYTQSGDYVQHFQTSHGCDSAVTLHLTIWNPATSSFNASACDDYTWNGQTYTQSGDYVQHFQTSYGCDSTVTLHLTINHSVTREIVDTNCMNYTWNGQTYTQSGDYVQHFQTSHGCDSVVTLHLNISQTVHTHFSTTSCDSFAWNGENYFLSGDYVQQFTTSSGCDSVITLHLTIAKTHFVDIEDVACEGQPYLRHGFNVPAVQTIDRESMVLVQQLQSSAGCDSTVKLHLTIADTALRIESSSSDLCDETTIEIYAQSKMPNYYWNTGENTPSIVVSTPGYYSVTVSDADCSVSKSLLIEPCASEIYLPNTITPSNGDNMNDYFCLDGFFQHQMFDFSIEIYDRWGALVFFSRDKDFRWRGEVKGKLITNATYSYTIHYKDIYGERFLLKGNVLVL